MLKVKDRGRIHQCFSKVGLCSRNSSLLPQPYFPRTPNMVHFPTFLAIVFGGMEVIQPASAGVLAGLTARIDLETVFQRRQATSSPPPTPAQCESTCESVAPIIESGCSMISACCSATFEMSFFDCLVCTNAATNVTDYTEAQSTINSLYDECASFGLQLPVLTFPGQNPNQLLSSVAQISSSQISSSQITVTISSVRVPTPSIIQMTVNALTSSSPMVTATSPNTTATNTSTATSFSGIRSVETNYFNLIASVMTLGTCLYFAV